LDTGFFIALAKRDGVGGDLLARTKERRPLAVAAPTISEFWRVHHGAAESRFSVLKPTVFEVDEPVAKRAGELLRSTGGTNVVDAIVVALAERLRAAQIYTSDIADIERLLAAAVEWDCEAVLF
jgi:predicted nucleic acid-binding protein